MVLKITLKLPRCNQPRDLWCHGSKRLAIQFAVVGLDLARDYAAVYKPISYASSWLRLAQKNATIPDGKNAQPG